MGDPSRDFASFVGAKGPAYTIATACTSSARAIISAARLLRRVWPTPSLRAAPAPSPTCP
ncbi:MAG: beta-ketoacyl synthase N-terminal-like domain-containing protein [Sutterella wadsworthensis]